MTTFLLMSLSKTTTLIILIQLLTHLLQEVTAEDPLYVCLESNKFSGDVPFQRNLAKLLATLDKNTPPSGFAASWKGDDPDRAAGLALCRGDVSAEDCQTYLDIAINDIPKLCPNNKEVLIYYDKFHLRYSNINTLSDIDDTNAICLSGVDASNPGLVNQQALTLFGGLSESAASSPPKYYATGDIELEGSDRLYGLVQCTGDLLEGDCKKCLEDFLNQFPESCIGGKVGGKVGNGSCNLRYEMYRFFA